MSFEEPTDEELASMQALAELFDNLCLARHAAGQEEYGQLTFMTNDVIRMLCEELADTANYCRYQFIKLMILQDRLAEELQTVGDEEQLEKLGIGTFQGTGKAWEDANSTDSPS